MSNSVKKSIGTSRTVNGVTVRRLPIGEYLRAVESIGELPGNLLARLFPELTTEEAFLKLKHLRIDTLLHVIGNGAGIVPDELMCFFAVLLGVSAEVIRDTLTPTEFMEVLTEFLKINDISNFIRLVKGVVETLR